MYNIPWHGISVGVLHSFCRILEPYGKITTRGQVVNFFPSRSITVSSERRIHILHECISLLCGKIEVQKANPFQEPRNKKQSPPHSFYITMPHQSSTSHAYWWALIIFPASHNVILMFRHYVSCFWGNMCMCLTENIHDCSSIWFFVLSPCRQVHQRPPITHARRLAFQYIIHSGSAHLVTEYPTLSADQNVAHIHKIFTLLATWAWKGEYKREARLRNQSHFRCIVHHALMPADIQTEIFVQNARKNAFDIVNKHILYPSQEHWVFPSFYQILDITSTAAANIADSSCQNFEGNCSYKSEKFAQTVRKT